MKDRQQKIESYEPKSYKQLDLFEGDKLMENDCLRCDKCLTSIPADLFVKYHIYRYQGKKEVKLCHQCNNIYDNRTSMLVNFLEDDYGEFPIGKADKSMIEARKRRSLGKSGWDKQEKAD